MNRSETQPDPTLHPPDHTILLVDDEPVNLAALTNYLADCGFQILVAQTGKAGLDIARRTPSDLILLDVRLPGIDGFEVCRRLKADTRTRAIPVIFMTIVTEAEDKVRGFEAGGVDYIAKPFQLAEVLARVTTHLRIRGLTRRLEEAKESLEQRVEERTAALRDSEERLRLTMEAVHIGSWDWDVQHDIWNPSPMYYTMLGYEPKAGPGDRQEWLARVHPDDRAYVAEIIQEVLTRELKEYQYEARLRHADGTYRWQEVRGVGIQRDERGHVTRMLGIRMDITEYKRAEEEIRTLNQELEQRVAARTAQLEASNKELEAFSYSVSHDMRAPLRHIDGFLELLHKRIAESLDAQSQHYMDTIADSARRMGLLIDDLLSFSRMGRHELSTQPVDLVSLVREVIQELQPETEGRNIHWQIADLPIVNGDRAMLRVVLVNLLANAIKFTRPRAQAEIEIGCRPGAGSDGVIFVRDNGVGFDMQYADKLFGVFQRLHRTEDFEGTGIGLANVRRIINRHGGRTWAEGQVNQGATFYFALPQKSHGTS